MQLPVVRRHYPLGGHCYLRDLDDFETYYCDGCGATWTRETVPADVRDAVRQPADYLLNGISGPTCATTD